MHLARQRDTADSTEPSNDERCHVFDELQYKHIKDQDFPLPTPENCHITEQIQDMGRAFITAHVAVRMSLGSCPSPVCFTGIFAAVERRKRAEERGRLDLYLAERERIRRLKDDRWVHEHCAKVAVASDRSPLTSLLTRALSEQTACGDGDDQGEDDEEDRLSAGTMSHEAHVISQRRRDRGSPDGGPEPPASLLQGDGPGDGPEDETGGEEDLGNAPGLACDVLSGHYLVPDPASDPVLRSRLPGLRTGKAQRAGWEVDEYFLPKGLPICKAGDIKAAIDAYITSRGTPVWKAEGNPEDANLSLFWSSGLPLPRAEARARGRAFLTEMWPGSESWRRRREALAGAVAAGPVALPGMPPAETQPEVGNDGADADVLARGTACRRCPVAVYEP
ncbi:hypothetical protein GMORB2_4033 [Geosmithia morbida]|uniref:Uncharacterized protein n=1 Tax=Geosmithia morbida TaxID=1094350 RepID=A0A9P5D859_9HYPO|nr:uncharacterized protein GMORB2_4033 [Geosmithia morbida]KAF4125194.1 hypothetical protein GMORB2_4033 [Geosmithia morbida]